MAERTPTEFYSRWGIDPASVGAVTQATGPTRSYDEAEFAKKWGLVDEPAAPAAVVETASRPGLLGNKPSENTIWGALKGLTTAAIKGAGDSAGFVGNTGQLADYLLARGESAITGKPVDQVLQSFAAKREARAKGSTLGKVSNALAAENVLPSGADIYNPILARTGEYVPESEAGKLAQAGAHAVFGGLGPGVRGAPIWSPAGAAAAPSVNALAGNVLRQAPGVGAAGAVAQGITDATGDPLIGMAGTAAVPLALRAGGAATNALMGTVDPNTARLAQTARNTFGIPVGAGDISANPTTRFLNSVVNRLPGSGGGAAREATQTAFNRSVAETFGENAERITPQVMARARDRIGTVFEDVANRTPIIHADPQLAFDLHHTIQNAMATMTHGEVEPLIRQVRNIAGLVDPNTSTITGEIYQNLTKRGAPLDRAMQSQNPNIRNSARDIREALDDAMQRSATPDAIADLQQARREWRNLRTVEPLVAKAPTGDISPALLQGRVNTAFKGTHGSAYGGGGDLKTLSDIGQRFMKEPPSSGTSERGLMMHLLGGAGTGGAGMALGQVPLTAALWGLAAPVATAGAARGVGSALRSDFLTNRLINNSLGVPTQSPTRLYMDMSALPVAAQGNALLGP